MSWPSSLLTGFLCALAGGFAYGFLAEAVVKWFRIGNAYGRDSFAAAAIVLAGALLSAVLGAAVSRWFASSFPTALALGLAATAGALALSFALAYFSGDVSPTLGGQPLRIEAEIMLAPGERPSTQIKQSSASYLEFASLDSSGEPRGYINSAFNFKRARTEDGRLIIAASVPLFTTKGARRLRFLFDNHTIAEFIAPIPARPSNEHLAWSPWSQPSDPAQPRTRFRVVPEAPIEKPEDPKLPKLTAQSPLADWVYAWRYRNMIPFEERQAILPGLESRLADFAPLLQSQNLKDLELALYALSACPLQNPPANLEPALRAAAATIAAEFQSRIQALDLEDPDFETLDPQHSAITYFSHCWAAFAQHHNVAAPPEIRQLREVLRPLAPRSVEVSNMLNDLNPLFTPR